MPVFNDYDRCPACGKKVKNMVENDVKLITIMGICIICPKCGNLFTPKSGLDEIRKASESKLILPGVQVPPGLGVK